MATIILADNQDITSLGIRYICRSLEPVPDIRDVSDPGELIRMLTLFPEAIVVLDYSLFDLSGEEELFSLSEQYRDVWWLLLGHLPAEDIMKRMWLESKRWSILWKGCSADELIHAFKEISTGRRYLSPYMESLLRLSEEGKEKRQTQLLTDTELQILYAFIQGKSNRQVAQERKSSIHTIYTHRKNIFRKLKVRNIQEAVRYAIQHDLIDTIEYYI